MMAEPEVEIAAQKGTSAWRERGVVAYPAIYMAWHAEESAVV